MLSIIPRLDEADSFSGLYASMMQKTCLKHGTKFMSVDPYFQRHHRFLWSWNDSVHISEDHGLPRLISAMNDKLFMLEEEAAKERPAAHVHLREEKEKENQCQRWFWRELQRHNVRGVLLSYFRAIKFPQSLSELLSHPD